jgi:hypothetical protein
MSGPRSVSQLEFRYAPQSERSTKRRLIFCAGRAFIGYSFAKASMSLAATSMGCLSSIHLTVSLHGGVVNDPV